MFTIANASPTLENAYPPNTIAKGMFSLKSARSTAINPYVRPTAMIAHMLISLEILRLLENGKTCVWIFHRADSVNCSQYIRLRHSSISILECSEIFECVFRLT